MKKLLITIIGLLLTCSVAWAAPSKDAIRENNPCLITNGTYYLEVDSNGKIGISSMPNLTISTLPNVTISSMPNVTVSTMPTTVTTPLQLDTFEITNVVAAYGADTTASISMPLANQRELEIQNTGTAEVRYNIGAAATTGTMQLRAYERKTLHYPTSAIHVWGFDGTGSVIILTTGKL